MGCPRTKICAEAQVLGSALPSGTSAHGTLCSGHVAAGAQMTMAKPKDVWGHTRPFPNVSRKLESQTTKNKGFVRRKN